MFVLDSDAIQASAALIAAGGDDIVLVLRHGLLSAADLLFLQKLLGPVHARVPTLETDRVHGTG